MDSSTESKAPSTFFGSPPEPIFTESKVALSSELLEDALKLLASKNEIAVAYVKHHTMLADQKRDSNWIFKSGNPVKFIFEICRHFKLTADVQYRAAELFHRFMIAHILELYQHVKDSEKNESPIKWNEVESRLKHQIILRAVSCVQLASKLSSHYHIVNLSRAKSFLVSCGFRYASASIVQSEIRILKTLHYKVHNSTPLEFIEALLGILVHNDKNIPAKQLHGLSLKVLDVFYLCSDQVHTKLEKMLFKKDQEESMGFATGSDSKCPSSTVSDAMIAIKADMMLLATAVISTSAFILGQSQMELVTVHLSQITCILNEDIINYASVLLEEVFLPDPTDQPED